MHQINQENTPEVGDVSDINDFKTLISYSEHILIAKNEKGLVGFMLCMKENKPYKSKNYLYLSERYKKFLYVDRIAVRKEYRRSGIGKNIYSKIMESAELLKVPLLCEVNTRPKNIPSLSFHQAMGFIEIGENNFESYSVVYLKRGI